MKMFTVALTFVHVYIPPKNSKYSSPDCYLEMKQELHDIIKVSIYAVYYGVLISGLEI